MRKSQDHFLVVDIAISSDELLKVYSGQAHRISAISRDGRRVQFPAKILQKFILHDGIYGTFKVHFDAMHRFKSVEKIG